MREAEARVEDLYVPDRFEALRDLGADALKTIVTPVETSLEAIDSRFREILAAGRGGLMILHGASGAGKSTFLDTVGFFREEVATHRIGAGEVRA